MKLIGLVFTGWLTLLSTNFAAASIQIISSELASDAAEGGSAISAASSDNMFPPNSSVNAYDPMAIESFAKMGVNWSFAGGQTILDFSLDHHRSDVVPSRASSKETFLQFLALDHEPFALSGFYHVSNVGLGESGHSLFRVKLYDIFAMTDLYFTEEESHNASHSEYEVGPASGNLVAGNLYFLAFEALIETNVDDDDSGANGVGSVTLRIGMNTAVPEPTSAFVWGGIVAIFGAAACRRAPRRPQRIAPSTPSSPRENVMGRQFLASLASLLLANLPLIAAAQSPEPLSADEKTIRSLEDQERVAVLNEDTAALERLWAEQFIVNNPQNEISADRSVVLDRVKRGLIRYSKFERQIEAIRFNEDIAIVMGSETVVPKRDDADSNQAVHRRFTNIWRKTGTTWRTIARHANIIPGK